jgi:hypothetical protein
MNVKVGSAFTTRSVLKLRQETMELYKILGVGGQTGAVQRCPTCRGTGMQVEITLTQDLIFHSCLIGLKRYFHPN